MKRTISILAVAVMAVGLCMSAGADTDGGEKGTVRVALVDASGLEYFINTDVTFSTTESASGAASDATYTTAVPATTTLGGTIMTTLDDAFDGYNAVGIEVTSAGGGGRPGKGDLPAGVIMYNNNDPATLTVNGRTVVFNTQSINGINVSRKVFVPANNTFARWMTLVHNTSEVPVTIDVWTFGDLGSDENTVIHSTSSGDEVVTSADTWAVSYQDFVGGAPTKGVGGTSDDPRLGHVFFDVDEITFDTDFGLTEWRTSFELPVGERRIVLNYVAGMPSLPSAEAIAMALADPNTATNAKDFMTNDEIRDTINVALKKRGGSSSSTCFIATAAYGTPMAEEINTLRAVRDSYMLNNAVGAAFVDTYYRFSPPIADVVAQSPALRLIVRVILAPIVLLSKLTLMSPLAGALAMLAMGLVSLRIFRKVRKVWARA